MLHAAALMMLISLLAFAFLQLAPGNYTDSMRLDARSSAETLSIWRARYGLDQPLAIQYFSWLRSVFRGEFGFSFAYGMPVGSLLWPRIKNTLLLTTIALAVSWSLALPIGMAAAAGQSRTLNNVVRGSMSLLLSTPDLLIALALLMFAVRTGLFPAGGMAASAASQSAMAQTGDVAAHLVLPVLALVLVSLPVLVRHVHAAIRESIAAPFVQAARAHGIPRGRLWLAYKLPAAANPLVSLFGYSIGGLLSSSLLVEVIMGWPGLGPLLLEAIFSRDVHVVIGATMLSALFLIAGNLIADLLLYAIDPRIRWEK
jgi:peptide/nickel transport system permease protein